MIISDIKVEEVTEQMKDKGIILITITIITVVYVIIVNSYQI